MNPILATTYMIQQGLDINAGSPTPVLQMLYRWNEKFTIDLLKKGAGTENIIDDLLLLAVTRGCAKVVQFVIQ